ncbi:MULTISPECIES: bifunctional 3-(3-hydroxy-phenyl)propionate/3-hydroxycinnamic acid hydroxylase [unclassified Novosphingobium]|uniref:bifunctional 3-(3-hydroxy-phenyl)propionate/3-hydroxycinnamic acid hydroxylase MhpA n=1 Tax=unclassified Novosphingobium TaxID=2644732 RepID=UPI0025E47EB8|nr:MULTISPECIES: bifunctional 3-(3-hydroxy-phenyl)propionate/3-hydroxycinnamic acid hydroxylase [unclassified Novosphingobium]HQV04577.1 bifunctional 3-(3-hydroxy-phenyl)propionate/3-hydroxycinnamic acid hydroxylase [Novosphingobium sp.]
MNFDCDVLIVGGGPTGVTLAVLLARRGVEVIVIEKEADIYPLPRAAHIDHEGMRILQEAGAAEAVMKTARRANRYDFLNAKGEVLLRFEGSQQIGPGGWPAANMIHQPSVEAELRRALASHANAALHSGWELTRFSEEPDGVAAMVATPEGEKVLRARYLVGADGARSPVRKAAGIHFDDLNFEEPWLVVDVLVDDYSKLPTANLQICNPERPTTCVLMGEGRHRWEFMIKPGETAEQISEDAFIDKLLEPWNVKGAVRLERKAVYTFRARIAAQWCKGRVLLAGDAAHQTPPFAGQGMCSGLRDAANLAWKLAAVTRDGASDSLLDTYQVERAPNLRAAIDMAIMMGKTVCITSKWGALVRDLKFKLARKLGKLPDGPPAYPPISAGRILAGSAAAGSYFPQPLAADGSRLDEVLCLGHWLIARADLAEPRLAPFARPLSAWLDKQGAEAVLVRPDRYVFGTGAPAALRQAWAALPD